MTWAPRHTRGRLQHNITMSVEPTLRPKWEIDRALEVLLGCDIRVAAQAFCPAGGTGPQQFRPVRSLFLPDNSQPDSLPVFFEGRLRQFERSVGVVTVWLDAKNGSVSAGDGRILFRGYLAVLLQGPAVVQLAAPFCVERLPTDADNYWRDLQTPRVQFELPLNGSAGDDADSMGAWHRAARFNHFSPLRVAHEPAGRAA